MTFRSMNPIESSRIKRLEVKNDYFDQMIKSLFKTNGSNDKRFYEAMNSLYFYISNLDKDIRSIKEQNKFFEEQLEVSHRNIFSLCKKIVAPYFIKDGFIEFQEESD